METLRQIVERTGFPLSTLAQRVREWDKKGALQKLYQDVHGRPARVFDRSTADRLTEIRDYRSVTSAVNGRKFTGKDDGDGKREDET